jgi:hypothetical protein
MLWGTDKEPDARRLYSLVAEATVEEVGFVCHPKIAMAGASPDGHVGTDGSVEIKCPLMATHIATLLGAPVDGKYVTQIQWQLACSGRAWCDFVSFDPRLPPSMQLSIKRVPRDAARIVELEREVREFLAELDDTVARLRAAYGG